jgi:hypothetical protein
MKKTPLARKKPLRAKRPNFTKNTQNKKTLPKGISGALKSIVGAKNNKAKARPPISKLKKQLWEECKRIVRARHGLICYTCGAKCDHPHTGHYLPSSVCSVEMRYSLDNLRPQCFRCNIHLSGNWPAYEAHLIIDHGRDFPEQLKQKNRETTGRQYDILWYTAKLEEYRNL